MKKNREQQREERKGRRPGSSADGAEPTTFAKSGQVDQLENFLVLMVLGKDLKLELI